MRFANRVEAGRRMAERLRSLRGSAVVILGLPRGGVPVAAEVARVLHAPLDVILVRKLGVPSQPELGMGAIGEDGVRVVDAEIMRHAGVSDAQLSAVESRERDELERRARRFRGDRARVALEGRVAVIIDDGIATGSTAKAACRVARAHGATKVILAVPVAPTDWVERIGGDADECIALATPEPFWSIGQFYEDFSQTSDDEVIRCLTAQRAAAGPSPVDTDVQLTCDGVRLDGHLTVPQGAGGIVVFAHGSGSSRHSSRNQAVAGVLHRAGLGTLLFDLLTPTEAGHQANVFDVELLAARLSGATRWLHGQREFADLRYGYFGASTGAAAALWAAADPSSGISAVVSRGGRPDLAGSRLGQVRAPTLLIVGSRDEVVLRLNRQAAEHLRCMWSLEIVPGATHLFEEPGTLDIAATLARDWFLRHLRQG